MDKKTRTELIIIGTGVVIFIVIMASNLSKMKPPTPAGGYIPGAPASAPAAVDLFKSKKEGLPSEETAIQEKTSWGRDPFYLEEVGVAGMSSISSLKLMGITTGTKTKPIAIINNELVSEGAKIGKFTVMKITQNKVVISDGENRYELKLSK